MKKLVIGVLAHVDAGKTTLCEALLYLSGQIKQPGRVDHGDACLDHFALERARGITIFSKQALIQTPQLQITLLDTPGHVDFSAEMERTLQALDYAILVISGTDGVQAHTRTLWQLLRRYEVPTFVFVTKMDLPGSDEAQRLAQLQQKLDGSCIDFTTPAADWPENLAVCDEQTLEHYLSAGEIDQAEIARLVRARKCFPCFFGSGLRLQGVQSLLDALQDYTVAPPAGEKFAASVLKISRDSQGGRLTFLKLTGGTLSVREAVSYCRPDGTTVQEKVNQLRVYSGAKFTNVNQVQAGDVCAVLGLSQTRAGQGLGAQPDAPAPQLQPVLRYQIALPQGCDARTVLPKLMELEEEDPMLHIGWEEATRQIYVQLMGEVQIEVLAQLIQERFGIAVQITAGQILYQETIAAPVEGVGHFEPLRHYAEVHLLLEPLERGSGVVLDVDCSEDVLDRNWQRLILTHLGEKQHLGVLTGAPVTDLKITLKSGKAHLKHTEGGDFRQAAYRAVRQGLMQAQSILLEPFYTFELEVPAEQIGRAIQDVRQMCGEFEPPDIGLETAVLRGRAPVSTMRSYARDVAAYTRGTGLLQCRVEGYAPCHNSEQVCQELAYEPEADLENTPDSVFCAHGAGFNVKWNEVASYMHLPSILQRPDTPSRPQVQRPQNLDDRQLEEILEREFGPIRRRQYGASSSCPVAAETKPLAQPRQSLLVIDGYNVIFAWEELAEVAAHDLEKAREDLLDLLANYYGFTKREIVVVFDAYRVRGGVGSRQQRDGITVVYTKENETGDLYIERLVHDIGKNHTVRVVSSDGLIQLSALRTGVLRVSAREFRLEMEQVDSQIAQMLQSLKQRPETLAETAKLSAKQP